MFCSKCGKEIKEDAKFCPYCGNPTNNTIHADIVDGPSVNPYTSANAKQINNPPKNKWVAALCAFFLGTLGIHNFYLGYNGKGLAQLLLTFFVIGAPVSLIWSFIEFIMILCDNIKDSCGRSLTTN